jgi:VanZ family protein
MAAAVIAAGALMFLVWETLRNRGPATQPVWVRIVRFAPFVIVSFLSVYVAARAPRGRKPFQIDLSVSLEDLARSLPKVPHLRSVAVILLLAAVAFGAHRLLVAFIATMLVSSAWEIAQTTVVGHNAQLADLAPNLVAATVTAVALLAVRTICEKLRRSPRGVADVPRSAA